MATVRQWWEGARPRTWSAAVAPVVVGAAVGYRESYSPFAIGQAARGLLALAVALALQVGVNYANDYSDGIRGTDEGRIGPARLVGQGLAKPAAVKRAALASLGVAGAAGLVLTAWTGAWWLLAVGAAGIVAAWLYTGGSRPYGYAGLGEAMVFVFFGVVAVVGTAFVVGGRVSLLSVVLSIPTGLQACALLVVNNLRDIDTDTRSGKRTLAVRLGSAGTSRLFRVLVAAPYVLVLASGLAGIVRPELAPPWILLALLTAPLAVRASRLVGPVAENRQLVGALGATARMQILFATLLAVGTVLGGPAA